MNTQRPRTGLSSPAQRGTTLIELMTALAVLAMLIGVGMPSLTSLVASNQASGSMMQLRALLGFARQNAITLHREVTLCGTSDGSSCARDWRGHPTLVFIDSNLNRKADTGERILMVSELTRAGRIRWSASGTRAFLRYRPDGSVAEYGNFSYCPPNNDARHARQLILSMSGRPRAALDTNGDGIVEDANGKPLRCD